MNASDLVDAVESARQTELSRLGSSKALYADTGGQLEPDRVLGAMADDLHHATTTLRPWTDESDPEGVFGDAAARLEDQYDALAGELEAHEPGETPAAIRAVAAADDPIARLGALVGWVLVTDRKASQVTGFFTGQADPQTASLVRETGQDFDAIREAALVALSERANEDLERARDAAERVIQAAYDDYVETLESMGVNPKPVC